MKNLRKFLDFIKEELRIDKMDSENIEQIKRNILTRLGEYKSSILDNIVYNFQTNKVEYKSFEKIEVNIIMRELNNEFTPEVIQDLNIDTLLRKINQLMELKRRDTKSNIRKQFDDFVATVRENYPDNYNGIDAKASMFCTTPDIDNEEIDLECLGTLYPLVHVWQYRNKV